MKTRGHSYGRTPACTSWTPTPEPASTRKRSAPSESSVDGPRRWGLGGGEPVPRRIAFTSAASRGQAARGLELRDHRLDLPAAGEEEARRLLLRRAPDGVHFGERNPAGPGEEGVRVAEAIREAGPEHVVTIERRDRPEQARLAQRPRGRVGHGLIG